MLDIPKRYIIVLINAQRLMKTLKEIKESAKKGDYTRAAEIISSAIHPNKISSSLVRMVVNEAREDHHHIQRTLSKLLEARERIAGARRSSHRKAKAAKANACLELK